MFQKLKIQPYLKHCFATITPRWIIFMIDMALVSFACFFVFYVVKDSYTTSILFESHNIISSLLTIIIFALSSRITCSYWGVIRYTGHEDAFRIFKMTMLSGIIMLFVKIISGIWGISVFSMIEIVEMCIFSFSFILLTRIAIKSLYYRIFAEDNKRKKVIILGSEINSIVLATTLKNEVSGLYNPVAILSLRALRKGDNINGIPIIPYNADKIKELFLRYDTHSLIFLSEHLDLMKKGFADQFLEADVELLLLNQIEEFSGEKNKRDVSSYVYNIKIEDLLGRAPIHTDNPNIYNMVAGKVVMVTGAAGSIGSEIVRQVALFKADKIILLDQAETPMHDIQLSLAKSFPDVEVHLFIADIQNVERLRSIFSLFHPHYVFHAAAYKHVPMMESNPTEAILTNVGGTRNIANLSCEFNVEKFVMVSTDKAVNPTNIMGCSKRIAEIYVQSLFYEMQKTGDKKTAFITTRFGNVLGSNGSVVPLFKQQIAQGGPVTVTHRDIIRYFMTIPEACNLVLEACCMGNGGEIYIFDMGDPVKIYDLAKRMIHLSGLKPGKDIDIVETGLRPGEKLYEELLNDKEKTTTTYHKKIMIAQVRRYEYNQIVNEINSIVEEARSGNEIQMIRLMKRLVPEYKSRNSIYEELDKNIEESLS